MSDGENGDGSGESEGDRPSDSLAGRLTGGRPRAWILLTANRWAIAVGLSAAFFALLVALGAVNASSLRAGMRSGSTIEYMSQGSITALITGVTLVVSINQLVISQELGPLGDQRDRMKGAMDFRADSEELLPGAVSPVDPSEYLQQLIEASERRATDLRDAVAENDDADLRADVDALVDGIVRNSEAVREQMEDTRFGHFEAVRAALNYNYNWKIYRSRLLQRRYADALGREENGAFDEVIETLTFFGPAREHFKTLYFQWELVNLSRSIIYATLPALAVAFAALLYLDPGSFPGAFLGVDHMIWLASAEAAIVVFPFFLLASFIVRIATVAKRTLAIGPFVLRDSEREREPESDGR